MNSQEKLAVAYCRVSTDEQANRGLSLDVQEQACTEQIERDGYTLLKVIRDEGKSGGSLKRSGIQEIIELAVKKQIVAVYTISSDRLNRNTADYLWLRNLFRENRVRLQYVYQPMTDDSAMSRTMDTVLASFNEMQRLVTSEKVKKTIYAKVEAGYFAELAPIGYRNTANPDPVAPRLAKRIIAPDPIMAPLITEAFNLFATGNYNAYELNDLMHKKGLRGRTGVKMSPSIFYKLLKNRIYIGEVRWGQAVCLKGKHEPLVDTATFDKVQAILAANNHHACRRRKYSWLLSGFVYCSEHGRRYTAEWHMKKSLAYYHCPNSSGCGKYIEMSKMEEMVAEKFSDLEFSPEFVDRVIEEARAVFLKRRQEYLSKKQSLINLKTALEARRRVAEDRLLDRTISNDDFSRIRGEIREQLADVDEKIEKLEEHQDIKVDIAQEILHFTQDIARTYREASPALRRQYLGFFWDKFDVADGIIIRSYPSLLFDELLKLQQAFLKMKNPQIFTEDSSAAGMVINTGNWLRD